MITNHGHTGNALIKHQLHQHCEAFVTKRIDSIQQAIASAQVAANDETKSSAGDKYETGRAMMQMEIGQLSVQLNEALKLRTLLVSLSPSRVVGAPPAVVGAPPAVVGVPPTVVGVLHQQRSTSTLVQPGSLVITTAGNYYISISAGRFDIEGATYFAVSPDSPIGLLLLGKRSGEQCVFNKKVIAIQDVC